MNVQDHEHLAAVREFNPFDLCSKADELVDVDAVRPYYQRLIAKNFPPIVECWPTPRH
jgi:inositol oxygenase